MQLKTVTDLKNILGTIVFNERPQTDTLEIEITCESQHEPYKYTVTQCTALRFNMLTQKLEITLSDQGRSKHGKKQNKHLFTRKATPENQAPGSRQVLQKRERCNHSRIGIAD